MLFLTWNTGSIMQTIKNYQPTPERIKSHQDHEAKRKADCIALEIKMRDKWKEIKPNKSIKKK
jgi:hypothetical protein